MKNFYCNLNRQGILLVYCQHHNFTEGPIEEELLKDRICDECSKDIPELLTRILKK